MSGGPPPAGPGDGTRRGIAGAIRDAARDRLGAHRAESAQLVFVNGWEMDFDRVTALLFVPGDAAPALVAKWGRGGGAGPVRAEHTNLETIAAAGSAALRESVPGVVALRDPGGRGEVLLLESALAGAPLAPSAPPGPQIEGATTWLARFGRDTGAHLRPFDRAALAHRVERPIGDYLAGFSTRPVERAWLERLAARAGELVGSGLPQPYLHGDFCPANLLWTGSGGPGVIDWETPLEPCLPAGDLIHLLASLAYDRLGRGGLEPFQAAFFAGGGLAAQARAALCRYAEEMAFPVETLRLLLGLYWVEYALEKARLGQSAANHQPLPDMLRLAAFAEGGCLNVRALAENDARLALP